jgi:hypothetical protein
MTNVYNVLAGNGEGKTPLVTPRHRWNITIYLK